MDEMRWCGQSHELECIRWGLGEAQKGEGWEVDGKGDGEIWYMGCLWFGFFFVILVYQKDFEIFV